MWNGYVYLLSCDKYHKIGIAKDVEARVKSMQGHNPYLIEIVHSFRSNNPSRDEKLLHNMFRDRRTSGEWFLLNAACVDYICTIKSGTNLRINPKQVKAGVIWHGHMR